MNTLIIGIGLAVGIVWLMVWVVIKDLKEDTTIKADTPNGHALPDTLTIPSFEKKWNDYHKAEQEAKDRYNRRPSFPTDEKSIVEIEYNYLAKNPNCTIDDMIDWIREIYKNVPSYDYLNGIYMKWLSKGVLPHRHRWGF